MKHLLIFFICLASLHGCTQSPEKMALHYIDSKISFFVNKNQLRNLKALVIIPRAGCTGCIDNTTNYIRYNYKSLSNTHIVFTAINDKKLLKLKVGKDLLSKPNVHFDDKNIFSHPIISSPYPQLILFENGLASELISDFEITTLLNYVASK